MLKPPAGPSRRGFLIPARLGKLRNRATAFLTIVSDGVDAPSERRHFAPEKTPDELRVKTRRRAPMEQATIIGIDIS